jgi:molybdopterin synthase catalytic subunit
MSAAQMTVTTAPLSADAVAAALEQDLRNEGEGCGALCTFVGVVRATHQGRAVRHIDYEAFGRLAEKTFARIAGEARSIWPAARVAIHHRVGRLTIGEASVVVAAAAAHRAEAFQVSRYAIERVKQIAPVWKHEFFESGDEWVEGAVADPDDEAARRLALRRACA